MTEHVDAETLAMFREGLLAPDEAAVIGEHLAGCDHCSRAGDQLASVPELLATAPAPSMPPALSARIEAALAAESAARAAAAATPPAATGTGRAGPAMAGAGVPDGGAQPDPHPAGAPHPASGGAGAGPGRHSGAGTGPGSGRPPRRASRLARSRAQLRAMAAAAAIIVIGGGGYAISQLAAQNGSAAQSSSASAPRPQASRPGAPALGMVPNSPAPVRAAGRPPLISTVTTGTDYTARQFSSQLRAVLARYPAGSAQSRPAGGWRGLSATGIAACVNAVTGGQHPRLVDIARYRGKPAVIIVVTGNGTPAHAWVVAPDCTAARHHLIFQATLPGLG